ncbi:MAG: SDH family Clp fold serine proteinase [Bacillota bacterium]
MQFSLFDLVWLILAIIFLVPFLQQHLVQSRRLKLIEKLENQRRTRVITLIHRQEMFNLMGLPISRYINIEDSEQILRAIRYTPGNMPIDIILHTPGGLVLAAGQIALALKRHPAKVTVFVPHYAMSGGTMIALAADEIVMDENAVMGPVDPQIGQYPAISILRAVKSKDVDELDDETLILADIAEKAVNQVKSFVEELIKDRMPEDRAREVATLLTSGNWTHDYPITCEMMRQLGIPIGCGLPNEINLLMDLFPQISARRPSVLYVPIPYENTHHREKNKAKRQ